VESPLEEAWAFPKFNGVFLASGKEMLKFVKNCSRVDLIWVRLVIKDFPSCVDGVSDNDDFENVLNAAYLVNATSNGEKLGFCTSDECYDQCLLETAWTGVKGMTI